ncbi:putative phage cell wall peptidase, NlpC/P60 family [Phaeobacter piscinae]|uniref:Phage cell wall peptidase, NlpC/P60 family n=1 Tax=Phaeobacter piscinae TaxID=1580596 RepID=A0AAN1LAI3_9RHOB|nr:NlpC/P60 family protein [Phaeobacter piscinae]ATG43593.1 putative phage cell wall peptidase, NlpC/P60 family [Phaeobacter piscinae]AUR35970.1 putative phage cell wall peptidase, NlpC/P60 family [Phaeobacter piscinae]
MSGATGVSHTALVAAARGWLGTPYVHQAATRGAGCDCLGLIRGLWHEVYGQEPEAVPGYTMDWSEPQGEEALWQAALRHLTPRPLTEARAGDVILFRMRRGAVAKHIALQTETGAMPRFIHAYSGHGVVENTLSHPWHRRIVARFSFPDVDADEVT